MALPDFATDSVFTVPCRSPGGLGRVDGTGVDEYGSASATPVSRPTSTRPTGETVARVLVVHCGGTIGMEHIPGRGYAPSPGFLREHLRTSTQFHDAAYRIPCAEDTLSGDDDSPLVADERVLIPPAGMASLRSGEASGVSSVGGPSGVEYMAEIGYTEPSDWLAMPLSIFGRRVLYRLVESEPLQDSSNATQDTWTRLARLIGAHYRAYDAFVVLHGTDTMAYTASALSFLLENLGKSVVFTGSQIPFAEVRNDAAANLLGALTVAGHYVIPEVTLFFANRLLRGCRAVKADAAAFDAFASPNCKWIARLGVHVDVHWERVYRPPGAPRALVVHSRMDPDVSVLRLFPGISAAAVRAALAPPVRGVVVETFGAGNAPDNRPDLRALLAAAVARGVVMVNVSQCGRGAVAPLYSTALGGTIVPGADMTTEAALTKLSWLLGREDLSAADVARLMQESLRGELSSPVARLASAPASVGALGSALGRAYAAAVASAAEGVRPALAAALRAPFLHMAASSGDTASLDELYAAFAPAVPVDCPDSDQQTTLHAAVRAGRLSAVRWLLERGANVHHRDRWGRTALIDALDEWRVHRSAHSAAVAADGASHTAATPSTTAPRGSADECGDDCVADGTFDGPSTEALGKTPGEGQPWDEIVDALSSAGATLPSSSRRLRSLLMRAARTGDTALIACLHRHGLDVGGARNEDGRSVLHVAVLHGQADVVRWLRGAGLYRGLLSVQDFAGVRAADLGSL